MSLSARPEEFSGDVAHSAKQEEVSGDVSLSARPDDSSGDVADATKGEEFRGDGPLSASHEDPKLERPPDYADYRPARTTAEGGATMLLSGVFLAGAIVVLGLAVYTKLADVRTFGQIQNLLIFAVALLLIAVYLLVWEIALRLIARADE